MNALTPSPALLALPLRAPLLAVLALVAQRPQLGLQPAILRPRLLHPVLVHFVAVRQLRERLLQHHLLQRLLVHHLVLLVFQVHDVVHRPLEDGAFVLLAAGDDLGELVDAFVDGFAAAALDCRGGGES